MPSRSLRPVGLAVLNLVLLSGCADTTVQLVTVYHPTLVQVSPDAFLGNVPCRTNATGAMKAYVATILDVGPAYAETEPFALPSSGPVSCKSPVAFSRVLEPHRYRAEVQGYERDDLVPLGSDDPNVTLGIPILVDPTTLERVSPRWTTTCGESSPTTARLDLTRTVTDCKPMVDTGTPGPTAVEVRIDNALGTLRCGTEPGEVEHFEVDLGDGSLQSAPCGEVLTLTDIPTVGIVSLSVLAYSAGAAEARWGSTCNARPASGVVVQASCSLLDDRGALDVEPETALSALGLDCSALGELQVELLDAAGQPLPPARFVEPNGCGAPTRFTGVASGPAATRATLLEGATVLGSARCSANVIPGRAVTTTCAAEP